MSGVWCLVCLWTLITIHTGPVQCSLIQFLERDEGDSVVLSCRVDHSQQPPIGVYLKRSWLRPADVLFQYERTEPVVLDSDYHNRTTASGDPSISVLNVTLSHLRPSDTDRYYCVFNVNNPHSEDTTRAANTEFFLLVRGTDTPPVEMERVDTCVGGSVVVPCVPLVGDSSAVEGVILKRQRGHQPVDILYHSKHSPTSSQFSVDRIQLITAPGPGGISYSLSVGPLQPEDTGLYSCQLLQGWPPSRSMGRRGLYVSVQGDQCGCSSYSALIYALSAAVAVTLVLLLVVVLMYRRNQRPAVRTHTPAPIYEEMTGLQPKSPKRSQDYLEEAQSEYRNCSVKKFSSENHYESPNGAKHE